MAANPTTPGQTQKLYPDPQSFAAFLNSHWPNQRLKTKTFNGVQLTGNNVGDQWLNWYATESPNHLNYSLGDFEIVFFDFVVAQSLLKGLSAAETATGQVVNDFKTGIQNTNFNPLSGLASIGDFFSRLSQANTWIRVGEVILGIMLITSGVLHISGADADITGIAKSAVKVVKK